MPLLDWAEARASDPITSQIAAEEISPKIGMMEQTFIACLLELGEATANEVAARAVHDGALNHESIRKRASGLVSKLVIYQHDQRICNHTGKLAQTYKVYSVDLPVEIKEEARMSENDDDLVRSFVIRCGRNRKCWDCKKLINPNEIGDLRPVQHSNSRWFHADCLELFLWRGQTDLLKQGRRGGKAGKAANGRVVRSTRNLGG
jgi:hypothetical protein